MIEAGNVLYNKSNKGVTYQSRPAELIGSHVREITTFVAKAIMIPYIKYKDSSIVNATKAPLVVPIKILLNRNN